MDALDPDVLDPMIHQATRLRLMTLLHKNREAPFTWLQERLGATPGNLDGHVQRLVSAGYAGYGKRLTDEGFQARVWITPLGDEAFARYVERLRLVLAEASEPPPSRPDDSAGEKNARGK